MNAQCVNAQCNGNGNEHRSQAICEAAGYCVTWDAGSFGAREALRGIEAHVQAQDLAGNVVALPNRSLEPATQIDFSGG